MASGPGTRERAQVPTIGMRGGLGRTLLTAFLVLAIVPLSTISWYATQRGRYDIQREVTAKLSSVAAMMEAQVSQYVTCRSVEIAVLAGMPTIQADVRALSAATDDVTARKSLRAQLRVLLAQDRAFLRLDVLDSAGRLLASSDPQIEVSSVGQVFPLPLTPTATQYPITLDPTGSTALLITNPIDDEKTGEHLGLLVGRLTLNALVLTMQRIGGLGSTGEIYLVDANGMALPLGRSVTSPGIEAALEGRNVTGLQENYAGVPVIGVYRWMPDLGLVLVAEQSQAEAFAPTDNVTAAVVGATLVVALVTAIIAAVVTRQITNPIVRLTESALRVAGGDMEQRVPVRSRDEIGILAYVFNHMTAELKALYDDLEAKVAQRTILLQRANYQAQRRAIQLAITVKVSQAVTSILEPERLLREVVHLVHDNFSYTYVGIYLVDEEGKRALLRAAAGGSQAVAARKARPVVIAEGKCAVAQAIVTGRPAIIRWEPDAAQETLRSSYIRAEVALPLSLRSRGGQGAGRLEIIGVLDILSMDEEDFDEDDVSVLQNVANQIAIALDNARAYAVEREVAKQLRELDRSKRRFLANMSHELRTPLTNIIGFSQLMLKGIDGPLTEAARNDLQIIYDNGRHLLGLINDLLDISHIEAGMMELEFRKMDLAALIRSVMATASALVRHKDVELRVEVAPDLPPVWADAQRIRQVLLRLLSNAAKFTDEGSITVRAWREGDEVLVSVSDTGVGIPPGDHERIFRQFEQARAEDGISPQGAGLGLALSKEFVEMHGGRIWVESEVGKGSTFTFSLPLHPPQDDESRRRKRGVEAD